MIATNTPDVLDRGDGGPGVGAPAGGGAPRAGGRPLRPVGEVEAVGLDDASGGGRPRADARHPRRRPDRPGDGPPRGRLLDAGALHARASASCCSSTRRWLRRVEFKTLLRESDFLSIHVPLSKETHHLIGAKELAMMKPGGDPDQHLAGADRRRGGSGEGAPVGEARVGGARRLREGAEDPSVAAEAARTWRCSRTSAARRTRRAAGWWRRRCGTASRR